VRWIKTYRDAGKLVTEFWFDATLWWKVTSYVWLPDENVVMAWLEQGHHPTFTYV
jgi:hypothetical protein